jgi:WD40 repeat protein
MRNRNLKSSLLLFLSIFILFSVNGQEVKLRLPKGVSYNTATANFSPNGKYVITAQMDNLYNLWDVQTGKYLGGASYQNSSPNSYVRSKFSPRTTEDPEGGKYYFIIGNKYFISIFETKTNNLITDIYPNSLVRSAEFSPDGKFLLSASVNGISEIWDVTTGKLVRKIKKTFHFLDVLYYATYSQDGKNILTAFGDKKARIWDVKTGKQLKKLKGHKGDIFEANYSPVQANSLTSQYILTESEDLSAIIWDAQTGKRLFQLRGHTVQIQKSCFSPDARYVVTASLDSTAIVWETETGKIVHHLKGHTGELYDVAFSPNGKYIATCSEDKTIILWSLETGKIVLKLTGHEYAVLDINFSLPSSTDSIGGEYLVSASKDASAIIWETSTGKLFQHLKGRTQGVWSLSKGMLADSINQFVFSCNDSSYYIMNYSTGKINMHLKDPLGVSNVSFVNQTNNEELFETTQMGFNLLRRDIKSSIVLQSYVGHSGIINNMDQNEKFVATASVDSTAIIWEIESGKIIHHLKGHQDEISNVVLSKNGQSILTASYDNQVKLWSFKTGELQKTFTHKMKFNKSSVPLCVAFSEGGDSIAVGYSHGEMIIWNATSGKLLNKFEGHYSGISNLMFSKNGKRLLSSSYDKEIILWDLVRDTVLKQFSHLMDVNFAFFSSNEKQIYSCSNDGSINLWDTNSGKKVLSHFFFDSDPNKWVHLHPSGLFDASPEAMELMYWTKGLEVIEFAQLKDRYWLPGLWEKVMKGEALPDVRDMQELKLQPEVEMGEVKDGRIPITLTKRDGGYGKVSIFINGKEVEADARGTAFDKSKETQTIWVDLKDHPNLQDGENSIAVKASSEDGFVQGRPVEKKITMSLGKPKPHFYAVVIGTGKYSNSSINLKYPEKDAKSMSISLKLGAEQLFGADKTHIYTLTTEDAERPTKERIKNVFAEIEKKATSTDIILIYLSGHGIAWGGDRGDFYYITTDAVAANTEAYNDEALRKNHTISTTEFTEYLKAIPALKQIMIIDACSSGKAVDNLMASRDIDVSQIKAIDRMKDRTGMFVISGSAADAVSYEASRYGQGLLTYSILQAMKGAALREDQYFDVNAILNYTRETVPKLAAGIGGIQKPQLLIPKGGSFDFGLVNEESKKQIPLSNIKPVFVRSSFMDTEDASDVLGMSKMIDDQLNQIAMRGTDGQLVFLDTREFPDSYRLSGFYSQTNGIISLKLKIKGPKESEHILTGKTKEDLVEQMIELIETIE